MFQSSADLIRRLQIRRRSEVYGLILPLKGEVSDRRLVLDEQLAEKIQDGIHDTIFASLPDEDWNVLARFGKG